MRKIKLKDFLKRGENARSVQTARSPCFVDVPRPFYTADCAVYDRLRAAVPLIDAAIQKIGRLVGGCRPICPNQAAQAELERLFLEIPVGAAGYGIDCFLQCYLDSLLAYGNAVGEVVLSADGKEIEGLYNAPLHHLLFEPGDSPLNPRLLAVKNGTAPEPVRFPELILFSSFHPRAGELKGQSLLSGLEFVCEVLTKIYSAVGQNFERIGNIRYAVTYKPGASALDRACAEKIAGSIAKEWGDAMVSSKAGQVKDFVAVGDVDIKVIGADCQMLDPEGPARQMLEQIIAKLGVPPFLLGLSWSSTERMSSQQADILTSELESYRRILEPVLRQICKIYLRLHGYTCDAGIIWDNINLQDEVELAQARLTNLQADQLEETLQKQKKEGNDGTEKYAT